MSDFSRVVSGYVGRRTLVVAGLDPEPAAAVGPPLVAAGVEVHVVTADRVPYRWPGVASWNHCDLGSATAIAAAVERVGAVVQYVFDCAGDLDGFRAVALAARPLMLVGGSIVAVGESDPAVDDFVRSHAPEFAPAGIRLLTARAEDALEIGLPGLA